jgi:hypothetical protein
VARLPRLRRYRTVSYRTVLLPFVLQPQLSSFLLSPLLLLFFILISPLQAYSFLLRLPPAPRLHCNPSWPVPNHPPPCHLPAHPHSAHSSPFHSPPRLALARLQTVRLAWPLQAIGKERYKRQSLAHLRCLYNSIVFGRSSVRRYQPRRRRIRPSCLSFLLRLLDLFPPPSQAILPSIVFLYHHASPQGKQQHQFQQHRHQCLLLNSPVIEPSRPLPLYLRPPRRK